MKELNNKAEYQALLNQDKPILLDFYADWCGPCQALLPTVEALAEKHKENFEIVKVNVDKNPELAQEFGVRSIPSLFFIENNEVKENLLGNQPKSVLETKIQSYLATA